MTLYRISNDKVCIGLMSDEGTEYPNHSRNRKIIDAPPFAKWAIGKETYHVLRMVPTTRIQGAKQACPMNTKAASKTPS